MKKDKLNKLRMLLCSMVLVIAIVSEIQIKASTVEDISYMREMAKYMEDTYDVVELSPDRSAWTIPGSTDSAERLEVGTQIYTGKTSMLEELKEGQHIYPTRVEGIMNVGYWQMEWYNARCIHGGIYENQTPYGLEPVGPICYENYDNGWLAYCADCNRSITDFFMYAQGSQLENIDTLPAKSQYYYLCPHSGSLEQGTDYEHECDRISYNYYKVKYHKNAPADETVTGGMGDTFHMYNNADTYNGKAATDFGYTDTKLRENAYVFIGYKFTGWNTEKDGTGTSYTDGQKVLNIIGEGAEDGDVVTLFAQWEKVESTLQIDASGGTYAGEEVFARKSEYGDKYFPLSTLIVAPEGYDVTFELNGGTFGTSGSVVSNPTKTTKTFDRWSAEDAFYGEYNAPTGWYHYTSTVNDSVDIIWATYTDIPITLPKPEKDNLSFAGWYYDEALTKFCGPGGTRVSFTQDTTLYAKWVTLALTTTNDYETNGKKGAVDLFWSQKDDYEKVYKAYQYGDPLDELSDVAMDDINSIVRADEWKVLEYTESNKDKNKIVYEEFTSTGAEGTYTIPYTGLYTFTALGAQGENYTDATDATISYSGGLGGKVSGSFWLQEGDVLTYNVGGQDGYPDGGVAFTYGSGGGSTTITSAKRGLLMVAGGGGGASDVTDGNAGGDESHLRADLASGGEDGMAGGGGGLIGGQGVGSTTPVTRSNLTYKISFSKYLKSGNYAGCKYVKDSAHKYSFHMDAGLTSDGEKDSGSCSYTMAARYNGQAKIPTNGFGKLRIKGTFSGSGISNAAFRLTGYKADGTSVILYEKAGKASVDTDEVDVSGYVSVSFYLKGSYSITAVSTQSATLSVSSFVFSEPTATGKVAGGGSNYVNSHIAQEYTLSAGVNVADGKVIISSTDVGYVNDVSANDIPAPDLAKPDKVQTEGTLESNGKPAIDYTILNSQDDTVNIKVEWTAPKDNGTTYYHKVESYDVSSSDLISVSNVTRNTLTTGVCNYYTVFDDKEDTIVTIENGESTSGASSVTITHNTTKVMYLHIAAIDVAGNLSDTSTIPISRMSVNWIPYTEQMIITTTDGTEVAEEIADPIATGLYPAAEDKTYYVRCDDETPFRLSYRSYINGVARNDYQITHSIYEVLMPEEETAQSVVTTPMHTIKNGEIVTEGSSLGSYTDEHSIIQESAYMRTVRSSENRVLDTVKQFVLGEDAHNQKTRVTPVAGVVTDYLSIYSEWDLDINHSIYLIGDIEAPEVTGMDSLPEFETLFALQDSVSFTISATDSVSGLNHLKVIVENKDNGLRMECIDGEEDTKDGTLTVEVQKEFGHAGLSSCGSFTITVIAYDNVGNMTEISKSTMSLELNAQILKKIDDGHTAFAKGEAAILYFEAIGHAEKVTIEWPAELLAANPDLPQTITYGAESEYINVGNILFTVPFETAATSYDVKVKAYKLTLEREQTPTMLIDSDRSATDKIRHRIR